MTRPITFFTGHQGESAGSAHAPLRFVLTRSKR